jgi:RNA polymerase-associated protein LEO1
MQSNTNVYRWSDGSVTMAVGGEQYEIQTKSLAPPSDKPYQEFQDAHYYTAAAHLASNSLLIVGRVTEQYTFRPNKVVEDDALERLQRKLEAAKSASTQEMIITTREDPELQKKQAELAEKERMKAQRRRETAAARIDGVAGRYNRGALSIGDLEGRRGGPGGRKRGQQGAQRNKRNRNAEYDSDDDLPDGARRVDDYVLDDFAVASDEEGSEEGEDDEEEEELLDEEEDEELPRRKKQKTAEPEDEDADGEADLDDVDAPAPTESSNRRRRHIIDDDDDDE